MLRKSLWEIAWSEAAIFDVEMNFISYVLPPNSLNGFFHSASCAIIFFGRTVTAQLSQRRPLPYSDTCIKRCTMNMKANDSPSRKT
jgi:hypothetical protein